MDIFSSKFYPMFFWMKLFWLFAKRHPWFSCLSGIHLFIIFSLAKRTFFFFRVTMWKSAGATSWLISHSLTFSFSYRQFRPVKSKWNSTVIISGNIWFPDKWDIYGWDPPSCSGVSNQQNSTKLQKNLLITLHCERIPLWEILGSVS